MSRGAACARTAVDAKLARSLRWFWNTHIEEQGPHALCIYLVLAFVFSRIKHTTHNLATVADV